MRGSALIALPNSFQLTPSIQNSDEKWLILDKAVKEAVIVKLFTALRSEEIEPILIKGWAAARFYPDPFKRYIGDVDVSVQLDRFSDAWRELVDSGLSGENIDLHRGFRDLDTVTWEKLFERSYLVDLNGIGIRVLGDEDHLRLVATHWLIDGGFNKVRLWDVYYLVENRKADFDWNLCLDSAGSKRKTWVLAAIATARDFLDLDVSGMPAVVREFRLPQWYVSALEKEWERGPYLRLPLLKCISRPTFFFQQARRRFPPNPIAATTDTEGPIDDTARLPYQLKSIAKKLRNAASRIKVSAD